MTGGRGRRGRRKESPGAAGWGRVTRAARVSDVRVPGYLGRVLDDGGAPVGTCFQV